LKFITENVLEASTLMPLLRMPESTTTSPG
jgi:hypothetical protein